MAYCTKCGKQNPESAKFCTTCGAVFSGTVLPKQSKVNNVNVARKRKWMIVAIGAIAGLCIAGYFLFLDKKPGKDTAQNNLTYNKVSGLYPYTSQKLLTDDDVKNISQANLRIMRNEIYARHGLIFQSPEMKDYFSAQSWYTPQYDNVIDMLSITEKNNIALIKRYENIKEDNGGE